MGAFRNALAPVVAAIVIALIPRLEGWRSTLGITLRSLPAWSSGWCLKPGVAIGLIAVTLVTVLCEWVIQPGVSCEARLQPGERKPELGGP